MQGFASSKSPIYREKPLGNCATSRGIRQAGQGVQQFPLPEDFKVAVGAGGPAGGAHQGDGLPLLHRVPLLDQQLGEWA